MKTELPLEFPELVDAAIGPGRRRASHGPISSFDVKGLRREAAIWLIGATTIPLRTIAIKLGFGSRASLRAAVKKNWGLSPQKIRELASAGGAVAVDQEPMARIRALAIQGCPGVELVEGAAMADGQRIADLLDAWVGVDDTVGRDTDVETLALCHDLDLRLEALLTGLPRAQVGRAIRYAARLVRLLDAPALCPSAAKRLASHIAAVETGDEGATLVGESVATVLRALAGGDSRHVALLWGVRGATAEGALRYAAQLVEAVDEVSPGHDGDRNGVQP